MPLTGERRREYVRKHREENRETYRQYDRKYYASDPEKYWVKWLRNYGITKEQYNARLAEQNGKCAICGSEPSVKRLAVDHDKLCCPGRKSCGKCIRGLLCFLCNTALGKYDNNPELLEKALQYLRKT